MWNIRYKSSLEVAYYYITYKNKKQQAVELGMVKKDPRPSVAVWVASDGNGATPIDPGLVGSCVWASVGFSWYFQKKMDHQQWNSSVNSVSDICD